MARVIQDSDDELEDDLEADLPPPKQPNASDQPPSNETSHGTGSTDSTESLKRAIEKAHRNHFQSQTSQDEPQSSVSLPEHPTKRRKTAADVSPRDSQNGGLPEKKVPVTYGKRSTSIFPGSPTFADAAREPSGNGALGADVAPSEEAIWNLEGTMHDEYAQHEPAMFPGPSSTVPNATMTQQRVLDVVNAPVMLGQDSDTVGPRFVPPPEPSVPLSDIWKFTQAEAADTESSDNAPAPEPSATPLRTSQTNLELLVSQRSRRGSSVRPRESPLRNEVFRAEVADMGQRPPPFEASLASVSEIPLTAPSNPLYSQESRESPRRRRSKAAVITTSDDDLAALGLPKEQYVPRPSRSKSLKVDVEQNIDFSAKSEKAKKVSKRRKTTAAIGDANVITTPQKIQQICEMGFTPSTTADALKRNNSDVTQTINWLVTNNINHDELAPLSPPKTKSTSKASEMLAVDPETIQDIMRNLNEYIRDDTQNAIQTTVANNAIGLLEHPHDTAASSTAVLSSDAGRITSPTKVQVVIPKRSPKTTYTHLPDSVDVSTKKPKRKKTTLDQLEHETESIEVTSVVPEVVTGKKKSRGRPKKAAKPTASTELVEEAPEPTIQEEHHNEVLQTLESNVASGRDGPASESEPKETQSVETTDSTDTAHPSNPPCKISAAPASENPGRSERSTKPTSASPSITKGKVPYRVGLSKRARIAPLLRTLKK